MLVITRHAGEEIWIGDDIRIKILGRTNGPGSVRVGVVAPEEVPILRPDAKCQEPRNG